MVTLKIIVLLTVLVFDKCNCKARHWFDMYEKSSDDIYDPDDSDYYPGSQHPQDCHNSSHYPSYGKPPGYTPPPRNVSSGAEVVNPDKANFMVRLFSKCGESNFTATVCMGVIIAPDTVVTAASCIYGQNFFQVCKRKPGETKCPAAYDPNDGKNCFVTDEIYIHPDFVGCLVRGNLCHNIAVLKFSTNIASADEVQEINFNDCSYDFCEKGRNATIIGCGNKIDTNLTFFMNEIKGRDVGVNAYGARYLQCPALYTTKNAFQTEIPCTGYAGAALFLMKTDKDVTFDPNVDRQEYAILYGLGSFTGIDCAVPSGFVALCDYKLFLTDPKSNGVLVANANKELEGFPLGTVIQILQTLLLDGAYISCTLQRVVRTISGITGLLFDTILERLVLSKLLVTLPI